MVVRVTCAGGAGNAHRVRVSVRASELGLSCSTGKVVLGRQPGVLLELGRMGPSQARTVPPVIDLALGQATGPTGPDTFTSVEDAVGSTEDDTLLGNAADNELAGGAPNDADDPTGDDHIEGREGDDTLYGRDGVDSLDGGIGTDECFGGETVTNCEVVGLRRTGR
jgi:RTX calcium-binding nonapeptide repeat (4 copies)